MRMLYSGWSKVYDATISWDPAYRNGLDRLVKDTVHRGDDVLEVGIGTGIVAEYGAPVAGRYVGLDYSGDMLAKTSLKLARLRLKNVELRWGDARELVFEDCAFDVVLSSFVIPHFSRQERGAIVTEMSRVLKPGGRLGLFLAQGEAAPLFPLHDELVEYLADADFSEPRIDDVDDVYRIVTASKNTE